MTIDLLFPIVGESLPTDHAYPMYAALSAAVPQFHEPTHRLRFAPVGGIPDRPGRLRITPCSCLRIRMPDTEMSHVLPLAGRRLEIAGTLLRLGVPTVQMLEPAAMLLARLATFKNAHDPDRFLEDVQRCLGERNLTGIPSIPCFRSGPRTGEPRRRIVRVRGKAIVGYSLLVAGLNAADSLTLQEQGLGGRARMGCGFFLPVRPEAMR